MFGFGNLINAGAQALTGGHVSFGGGGGPGASIGGAKKGGVHGGEDTEDKKYLKRHNICFIINNNFEGTRQPLPGYDVDEARIRRTFSWLKFDVRVSKNLTKKGIAKLVKEWMKEDYSQLDCFVCFVLTHGTIYDNINGVDEKPLPVSYLVNEINKVTSLHRKPKLFFIQACRGALDGDTIGERATKITGNAPAAASANFDPDASDKPVQLQAQGADHFLYFASSEGSKAYVDKTEGSFFVQELLLTMQSFVPGEKSLSQIVNKVNQRISLKVDQGVYQAAEARNKLTFEVFFTANAECFEDSEIRDATLEGKRARFYFVYFAGGMIEAGFDFLTGNKNIHHENYDENYLAAVQRSLTLAASAPDGIGRAAIIYEVATQRIMYSKLVYSTTAEKELVNYAERNCHYY